MFVQIDELPSTYSCPFESRSNAPFPSTSKSGSCSGAHHSCMFVNGCQTDFLSSAIRSSLFHSMRGSVSDRGFQRKNHAVVPQSRDEGGSAAISSSVFQSVISYHVI